MWHEDFVGFKSSMWKGKVAHGLFLFLHGQRILVLARQVLQTEPGATAGAGCAGSAPARLWPTGGVRPGSSTSRLNLSGFVAPQPPKGHQLTGLLLLAVWGALISKAAFFRACQGKVPTFYGPT